MKYWKRVEDNRIVGLMKTSDESHIPKGYSEITEAEYNVLLALLPPPAVFEPGPEPPVAPLRVEIDEIKTRLTKVEEDIAKISRS